MPPQTAIVSQRSSFSKLLTAFLAIVVAFLLFSSPAEAQEVGIRIKPATNSGVNVDPGVSKKYTITVENLNPTDQVYYLFSRNISGSRDGGVPVFASHNEKTGMELSDWVTLDTNKIEIPANGETSFDYTLNVPEDASPGAHLGAVFVSVEPPEIEKSGAAVGYQVAHIIDVRVSGDIVELANIRQFSTSKYLHGTSEVDFSVRIENNGNVLVRPRGPLEIYNMLGKQVGTVVFNDSESSVLPYETKEFKGLNWTSDSIGFGRYEAILSPIYGEDGARKTMTSTVSFWILPMNIIGPALGILAVLLLIVFIFVRLYIRRSVQHLSGNRRMLKRKRKGDSSTKLLLAVVMLTVTALFLIVLLALFA